MGSSENGRDRDRELVERFLRRREEKVFREIYRRHAPPVNRFVLRVVGGNDGDADDVVQTTWIRAIERLHLFRWESNLRTWLTGIALNCSRELLRKRKREIPSERIEEEISRRPSPVRRAIDRVDLERAIGNLPAGYREVLVLHDIEGYTHDEIGRLLGIEGGTSKSQLSRARRAVRSMLAGKNGYGNA